MYRYVFFCLFTLLSFTMWAQPNEDTIAVNDLLQQAMLLQTENIDSCTLLSAKALALSEDLQYSKGIKKALIRLGSAMIAKGNNDSALVLLLRAKEICRREKDARYSAGVSLLLSYAYQAKGMQESAFGVLYESLLYSRQSGDVLLSIQNHNALGVLYQSYKDYPRALVMYQSALQKADSSNEYEEKLASLMGIGSVYYVRGQFKLALPYYLQADAIGRDHGSTVSVAQNLGNIALCYADLKQEQKALVYYKAALNQYKKQGMQLEEANLYYNLGILYASMLKEDSAIFYLKKGSVLGRVIGDLNIVAQCFQLLARNYALKGDFAKAYNYQTQFSQISDSLMNSEKIRSISEMQTKYETEIKTTEIKVLQRENDISRLKASRSLGINFGLGGALLGIIFVAFAFYNQSKKKQRLNQELRIEKQKSDDLLLNILPAEIAEELKQSGIAKAKQYDHVTVLFTDFVNFTGVSMSMTPTELVEEINRNFTAFDAIMDAYGLEKIKTIGDAYLAVCGLPNETTDHAQRVIKAAIAIQEFMADNGGRFQIRIGIHTGSVVAGIVGVKKYAYDIWGDTVNTAARMEQHSEAGKINISGATYELVKTGFNFEHRGKIQAKNKGEIDMYFVA